jgi:hypothetical protein
MMRLAMESVLAGKGEKGEAIGERVQRADPKAPDWIRSAWMG